jgi:hypothetical protein
VGDLPATRQGHAAVHILLLLLLRHNLVGLHILDYTPWYEED